ncbi:MAG: exodeoxyribonuclease VII large subunit [Deltaproteobacteria bacterium]|nr:exodeoxyribonuclease VII large subunit [Deltaproteobacteria bacterium]MBW2119073.1 exodeoxyribonuclease VII large subunit [Deltaproteobacteria bacterium]MBW2344800.1 exodeoxyribonuclease VII large subunit [Deltaproteobacteria bacterium]
MLQDSRNPKIYSVTALTKDIQDLIEDRFDFIWVEGEISNFSAPASGHYYMVLKDEKSQIRAVMFRLQARYLKFLPENGMKVIVQGRIGVYAPRGEYQIILDYLEPMGVGALALAFEQLKKKLAARGIFDQDIKKPLPFLPQRVAVITSPTGAAIRDFLKIIRRRFANIEIVIVPVRVQGEEAAQDMVDALELVNRELKTDVIVLTRGGGSLEDLWAFNREELALAIRRSRIPVVSAVGHEIDLTISDLAADLRAPTPSAAAEILVVEKETLITRLEELRNRLISLIRLIIKDQKQELAHVSKGLKDPGKRLASTWLRLDDIHSRLLRLMELTLRDARKGLNTEARALILHSPANIMTSLRQRLDFQRTSLSRAMNRSLADRNMFLSLLNKRIEDLSPLSILKRGYSITLRLPEKTIVRDTAGMKKGVQVQVLLGEGQLECRVEKVDPNKER